jgi:hypothetical protein
MTDTDLNQTHNEPQPAASAAPTPADDAIRLLTEKLRQATEAQAVAEARAVAAEERAEAATATTANQSQASSKERWAIVIDEGHSETENHDVFVQVNGRAYLIQRGLVVHVPPEVVSVLKDAVVGVSRQEYDEFGRPKGISVRNAPRHPYRVIGKVIDKDGNPVA